MQLHLRLFAALLVLATAAAPAAAFAQTTAPDAAPPATIPSYGTADEAIHGRVSSFDGGYNLQVRDDRGFVDNVQLKPGTVINPTGIRLAPGMAVTIYGVNRGPVFAASEIDTPYQSYDAMYGPVPLGPYPYYPYPAYAYPVYGYPYGPNFSIGVGFGRRGFWR
jgi:hypothetical protein